MNARHVRIAVLAVLGATSITAQAENWEFSPRLELGYLYNDNYRLDIPGNEIDVSGGRLDVTLPIRLVDPVMKAELRPRIHSTFFPDARDEDSTDYFLSGLIERRTQLHTFGMDASISRQDIVRSELPNADIDSNLGDPTIGDSGIVRQRNRRDLLRVEPYWQYSISQRHRAEAGAHYIDADFEKTYPGEQQDYSDYGVYGGWGYLFSQRSSLTLRGRASHYETFFESDAYGAEVEWRTDYSQTAHLYVRLGGQQTELEDDSDSSANPIGGIGGRWTWPTTNFFADLTRSIGPTSGGTVVERSQFRLTVDRAVRPRLSLFGGARAIRDDGVSENSTYPTRKYLAGDLGFEWRFARQWSVRGAYNYIWQEYSDEPSDKTSNSVNLGVVYEPGRLE